MKRRIPGGPVVAAAFLLSAAIWSAGAYPAAAEARARPVQSDSPGFDACHYFLTLFLDLENETVSGSAVITGVSQEAVLDSIDLDFTHLNVDSVISAGVVLPFLHDDPVLRIGLDRSYAAGDTFRVEVFYHGHPGNCGTDSRGGFNFGGVPKSAYQVGYDLGGTPPSMGKYLFPCSDRPFDKATAEYRITVNGVAKKVISNGLLESAVLDSAGNTATYNWVEDCPVATHLMTLHAGRYADVVDSTYPWIHYWVYPRQAGTARVNFRNVHVMVDAFEQAFGPYPFPKCGYVVAPQADAGHQSCITYPVSAVTESDINEWRVARGLARQWWGACITPSDWRDVWLTESFCRYGEPLFQEYVYGADAYHDYVYEDLIQHTLRAAEPNSPVYDPIFIDEHTIYEKGAVVLHMLRYVLGDSVFFDALRQFRAACEYGCATTADFRTAAETSGGIDLDWFFDQWIFDCGWPVYEYAWYAEPAESGYSLVLAIDQVQAVGPVFAMPLEIAISRASGDTLITVWADDDHEEYALEVDGKPLAVRVDPNHWVLHESSEIPFARVPEGRRVPGQPAVRVFPNPFRDETAIYYSLGAPGTVRINVYDAAGRRIAGLLDAEAGPGPGVVRWDGKCSNGAHAGPGTYFCRVESGGVCVSARLVLLH
jgi:aminopeptidase N